ncbi:hypothetical protein ACOSQ2_007605 [Xanthoceras sorbifolium]
MADRDEGGEITPVEQCDQEGQRNSIHHLICLKSPHCLQHWFRSMRTDLQYSEHDKHSFMVLELVAPHHLRHGSQDLSFSAISVDNPTKVGNPSSSDPTFYKAQFLYHCSVCVVFWFFPTFTSLMFLSPCYMKWAHHFGSSGS